MVQWLPVLSIQIEKMHFAISVCVLAAYEQDLAVGDGEGAACPQWVLHPDGEHLPLVLVYFVHFDRVVNLLLCASEEATKSINEFICNRASTKVMALILHRRHLIPLVLLNIVLFNRAQPLLAREAAKHKHTSLTNCDCMCVPTFRHLRFVQNFVLLSQINSGVLFRWRPTASDQNLCRTQCYRGRALVEFVARCIGQLLERPLIFIDIVAETDFRVDVVAEEVNICLTLRSFVQRRILKQSFLNGAKIVNMNGILEHVIDKVRTRPDKIVQSLQNLEILPLLLMENIEPVLILVQLHLINSLLQLVPLLLYHFLSFLYFLLLVLELFYFFINLLLHHLEQILVLYFQLVHYSAERLFQLVDLLVELLSDLHF